MLREIDLKALKQNLKLPAMLHRVHSYCGKTHPCMYVFVFIREEFFSSKFLGGANLEAVIILVDRLELLMSCLTLHI